MKGKKRDKEEAYVTENNEVKIRLKKKKENYNYHYWESYTYIILDLAKNIGTRAISIFQRKSDEKLIPFLISDLINRAERIKANTEIDDEGYWDLHSSEIKTYPWIKRDLEGNFQALFDYKKEYAIHFSLSANLDWIAIALSKKGEIELFLRGNSPSKRSHIRDLNLKDELKFIKEKAIKKSQQNNNKTLTFKIMNTLQVLEQDKNIPEVKFWYIDHSTGKMKISKRLFLTFIENMGYRSNQDNRNNILRNNNNGTIQESSKPELMNDVIKKVKELSSKEKEEVLETLYKNLPTYFGRDYLSTLKPHKLKILKDPKDKSFLFFLDKKITVNGDSVVQEDYFNTPDPIWQAQIISRNYVRVPFIEMDSVIHKFCNNICNNDPERLLSLMTIIGFIIHTYKDSANPSVIAFIDETISEYGEANGGVGKSLLCRIFKYFRNVAYFEGRTQKINSRFALQMVDRYTEILLLEDVGKDFDFDHLIGMSTGSIPVEKKYMDSIQISFNESCKIVINTNFVPLGSGGYSEERRKFIFEVGNYYNSERTPLTEFGHRLFDDWDSNEWAKFDAFGIHCLQQYFKRGLVKPVKINQLERAIIQKTNADFYRYFHHAYLNGKKAWDKKEDLKSFKLMYEDYSYLKQNTFTKWIYCYLKMNKIKFHVEPVDTRRKIIID